jgi:hypothetical protein
MKQLKDYKLFLESADFGMTYVMGKPSCEIIYVNKDIIEKLDNADLVDYCHTYRGQIISCYCFADNEREDVVKFIKSKTPKKEVPSSYTPSLQKQVLAMCVDYQNEMGMIIGKKPKIAFLKNPSLSIISAIVPDLNVNKPFYDKRKDAMDDVVQKMKKKYHSATFYYLDRWNDPNINYLN